MFATTSTASSAAPITKEVNKNRKKTRHILACIVGKARKDVIVRRIKRPAKLSKININFRSCKDGRKIEDRTR
jgi:hypothetical protein